MVSLCVVWGVGIDKFIHICDYNTVCSVFVMFVLFVSTGKSGRIRCPKTNRMNILYYHQLYILNFIYRRSAQVVEWVCVCVCVLSQCRIQ